MPCGILKVLELPPKGYLCRPGSVCGEYFPSAAQGKAATEEETVIIESEAEAQRRLYIQGMPLAVLLELEATQVLQYLVLHAMIHFGD